MVRELLTRPITAAQLEEELAFLVRYCRDRGHEACEVAFGGAWAVDYVASEASEDGRIALDALADEVRRAATSGRGGLGSNDLFVRLPARDVRFRFCNDSDIYLEFDEPCDLVDDFARRWRSLGYLSAADADPDRRAPGARPHLD